VCANTSNRSRIALSREKNSECFTLHGGRSDLIIYQVGRANLLKSFSDLDSVSKISSGAVCEDQLEKT
jgi:hypothetical protein